MMINANSVPSFGIGNTQEARTMAALSSGKRINRAADDAAGSAMVEQFAAQIMGNNQAMRNLNDGISVAQTADGALSSVNDNTQRLRELAVAAGNGTLSASDRAALQEEAQQLQQANNDVISNTQFNGQPVLQGGSFNFQAGANAGEQISLNTSGVSGLNSAKGAIDLSSPEAAAASLKQLDSDLESISGQRATLGAFQNRVDSSVNNLQTAVVNQSATKSRIGDTDYAAATSQLIQQRVRNQAQLAMQAQANANGMQVMNLLRGV